MAVPQAPASVALGKYEMIKETTASSIATTWLARDPADGGRAVSVLRLHRHVAKRQEVVDAFLAEVRKASAIVHPHVARIVESGSEGGEVFVVQELIEGDTLAGMLRAAGAEGLPVPIVLRIARDVAAALDAAHGGGVAHGELAPWHVLLGNDGAVKVTGFGVAHALSRIGLHGVKNVDRLAYGAPERVKAMAQSSTAAGGASPPDAKGDVFSLGCLLWEAFSKERLFQSKMEAAVVQKVLTAAIDPVGKRAQGLPPEAEELVDRALVREPPARLGSVREALELLRKTDEIAATEDDLGAHVERLCGAAIRARREDARKPSIAPRGPAAPKPRTATLLGVSAATLADAREKADRLLAAGRVPADEEATLVRPAPAPVAAAPAETRLSMSDLEEVSVDVDLGAEAEAPARPAPPPRRPPAPPGRSVGTATPAPGQAARGAPTAPKRAAGTMLGIAPPGAAASPAAAAAPGSPAPGRAALIDDEKTNDLSDWVSAQEDSGSADAAVEAALDGSSAAPAPAATKPDAAKFAPPPAEPAPTQHARVEPSRSTEPVGPIEKGAQLGSYEILIPVARGGMASVWAGRTRGASGIADLVAIKTLLPELGDDPEFHKMFRDETRVASRIRHANVAGLFAVGEHGDTPYLVMEWVDGDTLAALLRAAKPLGGIPQGIVLRIASDVCAGLHAAHELKDDAGVSLDVVHRDITPANVLLTSAGEAKVVDFGVAKSKAQLHVTRAGGVVKGKTPYLSPEQLGGLPLDRRSDLFSLGTMLYVLTTGLHPFRGDNDLKTLENIAIKKPVPLRSIVPWIDPAFETLVLKLLEKDPRQRLGSASEVKGEIDRILETLDEPCGTADVAAFLRKALGEALDGRTRELEAAAQELDAKRGVVQPSKVVIDVPPPPPGFEAEAAAGLPSAASPSAGPSPSATAPTPSPAPAPVADASATEAAPAVDVPAPFPGLDGMAEEPLEEALARNEDTQRNRALTLRRRRLGQLVGLAVGAGVIIIGAAAVLSSGGDEATGRVAPTAAPAEPVRTAEPTPPPAPPEPVTAEPVATAEPTAEPSAEPAPTESAAPATTPPPAAAPPRPRPRPQGGRPRPPKKPPVYNPQGI